jgi:hypothetical protein
MERLLALDQTRYRKPIKVVREFFDFYMQLRIQGPIRITPNYPAGWSADVLSEDKVWTIECFNNGELRLIKVGDFVGYTQNGAYIIADEEDLSANIYYRYNPQWCGYKGLETSPPLCRDFCDDGKYDDLPCRFCPSFK